MDFPKPLLYCKLIARFPFYTFLIGTLFHLLAVIVSLCLYYYNYKILVLVFDDVPLVDKNYEGYQCFRAMWELEKSRTKNKIDWGLFYDHNEKYKFLLYFDGGDKNNNILTSESLAEIYMVEQRLLSKLKKDNVLLEEKGVAVPPLSLTQLLIKFNGNDVNFLHTDIVFDRLLNNTFYRNYIDQILCQNIRREKDGYFATAIISVLYLMPNKGWYLQYKFIYDVRDIHNTKHKHWQFYYEDRETFLINLQNIAFRDLKFSFGSLIFIYVFTYIQIRSVFLTIFGVTSIFTSFFIANFIHTVILGIKFFGIFHILSIYIILGIGCDDMYVFIGHWKANHDKEYPSLEHRLSDTYRSAIGSMFITSLTTAMAFSILIFTPLVTLSTFAIFTVLLVVVNYVSVILYFPAVIVVYYLRFDSASAPDKVHLWLMKLFAVHYYNFLLRKWVKEIILGFFALIAVGSIFLLCFKLEISDQFPSLLGKGTMYGKIAELKKICFRDDNFDELIQVSLISGLSGVKSDHCKFWDYKCQLNLTLDKTYNIEDEKVQKGLLDLCYRLKYFEKGLDTDLALKIGTDNRTADVMCFISEMNDFFNATYHDESYMVPWNVVKFQNLVDNNPITYRRSQLSPNFRYSFESAMDFWLFQGYTLNKESKRLVNNYNRVLYRQLTNQSFSTKSGFNYGLKLVVSKIVVNTTFYTQSSGYSARVRVFDNWINFKNTMNDMLPEGLNKLMVCSTQLDLSVNGYFHWVWVQRIINSVVLRGIILGLTLSFPIILLATMNIYETFFIVSSTSLTTLSIVAILPVLGWKLGFLEGTNLTLVVGLSVDYLVHMGLSYHRSEKESRDERLHEMLIEMPISVISGALTTLGASAFLFYCKVQFLFQFGFFLFITIGFASLYALVFFPSFIGRFGPSKGRGKLPFKCIL